MESVKIHDFDAVILGEDEWVFQTGFKGDPTSDGRKWWKIEGEASGQTEFKTIGGIKRCITSQNKDWVGHEVNGVKAAVIFDSSFRTDVKGYFSGYITYDSKKAV